ncbi:secondary thiamine-phosphate synthase enzyme YjbQ [candidate division CSSED10-310 bacterium]|uniref:Secondary thiamine-phosphate synthase enzyme YjbQ n=1 Tax=candidate division CSSED10-310 bacterium TaxID=2855610 RepID=A0ABV6Z352_UNCC1
MSIVTTRFEIKTQGEIDIIDVTAQVNSILRTSNIVEGLATIFIGGSTGAITTIEYESGAVSDLKKAIERMAPRNMAYAHDARWGDGNGFSHVRSALMGPSLQVPVSGGRLMLGTWQQIVFCDFDNRPRQRQIIVQILGD